MSEENLREMRILENTGNERESTRRKVKAYYSGSSFAMEPEGARKIFGQSISSYGLQYNEFYEDGDSKSFTAVQNIYEEEFSVVTKKECVGHVQKRFRYSFEKIEKGNERSDWKR